MDSGIESPALADVDVAVLRLRYLIAFERYRAQTAKLVELLNDHGRAPLVQQLEEERQALEDLAAMRGALMDALAGLAAETRDEMIRRSIAKRSQGGLGRAVRRLRVSFPRRNV